MSYRVTVTREGRQWLADVPGLAGAHTYAGNLESLAHNVEEVIRLVDDSLTDADRVEIVWDFDDVEPLVGQAAIIGGDRSRLIAEARQNDVATVLVLNELAVRGYSVRDISQLLKMSPGRVSQIRNGSAA